MLHSHHSCLGKSLGYRVNFKKHVKFKAHPVHVSITTTKNIKKFRNIRILIFEIMLRSRYYCLGRSLRTCLHHNGLCRLLRKRHMALYKTLSLYYYEAAQTIVKLGYECLKRLMKRHQKWHLLSPLATRKNLIKCIIFRYFCRQPNIIEIWLSTTFHESYKVQL